MAETRLYGWPVVIKTNRGEVPVPLHIAAPAALLGSPGIGLYGKVEIDMDDLSKRLADSRKVRVPVWACRCKAHVDRSFHCSDCGEDSKAVYAVVEHD